MPGENKKYFSKRYPPRHRGWPGELVLLAGVTSSNSERIFERGGHLIKKYTRAIDAASKKRGAKTCKFWPKN